MRLLPFVIGVALMTFSVAQEGTKEHKPTLRRSGDRLTFEPAKDSRLEFALADFRWERLEVEGSTIESWWGSKPGYQLNGGAASARAVNWMIDGKDIVLDIKLGGESAPQAATERVSVARLKGVVGCERRVHVAAPVDPRQPTELESRVVEFRAIETGGKPKVVQHLDHYGYSTVSSPGVTYTVHSWERTDGQRVWVFRSGLHLMNQALNPGRDPALVEVALVEPKGTAKIEIGDLIAAYVEVPEDRQALLAEFDPKRLAAEAREKVRSKKKR